MESLELNVTFPVIQRRRNKARQAQFRMRDKRSRVIADAHARNKALEDILEELGESFDVFSCALLKSGVLNEHKDVASAFRDTLRVVASCAQRAHTDVEAVSGRVPCQAQD